MDTTSEYIKMCEKAEEIQKGWKPEVWDYYYSPPNMFRDELIWLVLPGKIADSGAYGEVYISEFGEKEVEFTIGLPYIWLPRQDQLQEMLRPRYSNPVYYLVWDFFEFVMSRESWPSMEVAWLAFVMKELYSKFWNGEEWIKET